MGYLIKNQEAKQGAEISEQENQSIVMVRSLLKNTLDCCRVRFKQKRAVRRK